MKQGSYVAFINPDNYSIEFGYIIRVNNNIYNVVCSNRSSKYWQSTFCLSENMITLAKTTDTKYNFIID